MKISSIPGAANTVAQVDPNTGSHTGTQLRALKMATKATPGVLPEMQTAPETPENTPILDNNETKATVEETKPLSPQYAELAKKRRALQVKERELLEKEKALETKLQGSDVVPLARLKQEPLRVLLESGVTYEQLTDAIIANQGNAEVNALKAEVASLKQGIEQKFQEEKTQSEQQALAAMRKEAIQLVGTDNAYELVRETKSIPTVMNLIERTYRETGEVLDVSEACGLVEAELLKEAEKMAMLTKVREKLSPQQPQVPQKSQQPVMRTLANKHTASVPMDKKQRALMAFNGTLKQ